MQLCLSTYVFMYIRTYVSTNTSTYLCTCIFTHVSTCTYVYTYKHTQLYKYVNAFIHMCIRTYMHVLFCFTHINFCNISIWLPHLFKIAKYFISLTEVKSSVTLVGLNLHLYSKSYKKKLPIF